MQIKIHDNKIALTALSANLSVFTPSTEFLCKDVRRNYIYADGKKTDEVESISYLLADPKTLDVFRVKVPGNNPAVNPDDFAREETTVKISLPTEKTTVKPYKSEFGKLLVSITAPYVKLVDKSLETSDDDALTGFTDLD